MNLTKEILMQRRNEFLQLAEKAQIQQQQALGHVHSGLSAAAVQARCRPRNEMIWRPAAR